ncbi:hypothetical protein GW17_00002162 [Ensete ventricosum]|nr:hypothetical protein GW17_00002162 [Ensete ventricosum]
MGLQWVILGAVVAAEAAVAALLILPAPRVIKSRIVALAYLKRKETSFCVSWLVSFIGMAECIFRICKYHEELRELEEAEKRLKDQ